MIATSGGALNFPVVSTHGRYVAYGYVPFSGGSSQIYVADLGAPAGVTLSNAALALTEGGAAGTYTVVLDKAPSASVTVTVTPDKQLAVARSSLTFSPTDWSTAQTVSVTALQDNVVEGRHTGVVTHAVASTDPAYKLVTVGSVTADITDAVIPTLSVRSAIWPSADLPVTGTAAPGATVILTALNRSNSGQTSVTVVADANGAWSTTLTGLSDGTYELQAEADAIKSSVVNVAIDSHAPVTAVSLSAAIGPSSAGWYGSAVTLTMSAVDGAGGAGVARSEYTLDGGAFVTWPASGLLLGTDGNHSVCYRSVDQANNVEAARCLAVPIDTTAPQASASFAAANNTLTVSASDSGSGVLSIELSKDGGQNWTVQNGPLVFGNDGNVIVQYRVRDKAGNQTSGQTSFTVVTVPLITPAAAQSMTEGSASSIALGAFADADPNGGFNVDVDWGDGSAHAAYALATPGSLGAPVHAYADNGNYVVTVSVTDHAGSSDKKTISVSVLNRAPTATLTFVNVIGLDWAAVMSNPADASPTDTQAGLHYAFACDGSDLGGSNYASSGTSATKRCFYTDLADHTIRVRVIDKDNGYSEYTGVYPKMAP